MTANTFTRTKDIKNSLKDQISNMLSEESKIITPYNIFKFILKIMEIVEKHSSQVGVDKKYMCISIINELIDDPMFSSNFVDTNTLKFIVNNLADSFIENTIDISKNRYSINQKKGLFSVCCLK
ncbi:MAG TPA: hypothetical protein V6C58_17700 [Allocoleopsis sp.]